MSIDNLEYYDIPDSDKINFVEDYEDFVESMILTRGEKRLYENTLGLVGESGEIAEKIKKYIRDGYLNTDDVVKELGDVLFYITALTRYFGHSLESVMDVNMKKLASRKERNVLQGSGDNR